MRFSLITLLTLQKEGAGEIEQTQSLTASIGIPKSILHKRQDPKYWNQVNPINQIFINGVFYIRHFE